MTTQRQHARSLENLSHKKSLKWCSERPEGGSDGQYIRLKIKFRKNAEMIRSGGPAGSPESYCLLIEKIFQKNLLTSNEN